MNLLHFNNTKFKDKFTSETLATLESRPSFHIKNLKKASIHSHATKYPLACTDVSNNLIHKTRALPAKRRTCTFSRVFHTYKIKQVLTARCLQSN